MVIIVLRDEQLCTASSEWTPEFRILTIPAWYAPDPRKREFESTWQELRRGP